MATTDPSELIDDARNYAVTVTSSGVAALVGAMAAIENIGQNSIGGRGPEVKVEPPSAPVMGTVPAYTGTRYKTEKFDGKLDTLLSIGTLNLPSEPGSPPSVLPFNPPQQPSGTADESLLAGIPTVNTALTLPTAPDLNIAGIPKPVLTDLVIPTAPSYNAPEFLGVRPGAAPAAPSGLDTLMRTSYSTVSPIMQQAVTGQIDTFIDREFPQFRAQMAAIETRLATYMAGGTALTPAVENAIYARTLDKTDADARRQGDEIWGKAARAGFTMPSATLLAQMMDVDKQRRDNNARAATDIAIKQAELEQSNLQFAVTQSINLRQIAINAALSYYSGLVQINGQALEYAREVVDAVVKAYDLAVKYAEIQIRIYEADAQVYDSRVKGALAILDAYTSQVKAIEAQSNVDLAKVQAYRARIDAVSAEAGVYKTQLEAVQSQIEIEKAKVSLYGAKVNAYVAQVNGYTAKWQGYEALVRGEAAKVQASAEGVRAHALRVQAYEAAVRAKATELEAVATVNKAKIEAYQAQVEAYRAKVEGEVAAVSAEIKTFDATLSSYVAQANAAEAKSRAEVSIYEVAQRGIEAAAQLQYQYYNTRENINARKAEAAGRIAASIGDIFARTAQSTLAGMNTLAASSVTSQQ